MMNMLFSKFCNDIIFHESSDLTTTIETRTTANPMSDQNITIGNYA